jgi:hypothetical protein
MVVAQLPAACTPHTVMRTGHFVYRTGGPVGSSYVVEPWSLWRPFPKHTRQHTPCDPHAKLPCVQHTIITISPHPMPSPTTTSVIRHTSSNQTNALRYLGSSGI